MGLVVNITVYLFVTDHMLISLKKMYLLLSIANMCRGVAKGTSSRKMKIGFGHLKIKIRSLVPFLTELLRVQLLETGTRHIYLYLYLDVLVLYYL